MSECEYCSKKDLIYEDEDMIAFLSSHPACEGHIVLAPKKHHVIIEQVPDYIVAKMFYLANKLSIAAFDSVNALGSNILIQNGNAAGQKVPHVSINIIPRKEGDGLDFLWRPKQLSEEEMSTIEMQMKDMCSTIGNFNEEEEVPVQVEEEPQSGEVDYRELDLNRLA